MLCGKARVLIPYLGLHVFKLKLVSRILGKYKTLLNGALKCTPRWNPFLQGTLTEAAFLKSKGSLKIH